MHVRITNKTVYASAMYFSAGFNQLTAWPLTFINLELIYRNMTQLQYDYKT